jgi:hypothetical protein
MATTQVWHCDEDKAKLLPSCPADEACTISFTGPSGVGHSVEISANSLYEAAIVGFNLVDA